MVANRIALVVKNLLALALGVAIALAIGEATVRLVLPQLLYRFPQGMFVNDPELGYRLTPNFSGVSSTAEYRTTIKTNSVGFRENREFTVKASSTYRVLALGDSFTMGVGVEAEEAMAKVVESLAAERRVKRPIQVINAGVPGYNTDQELRLLNQLGLRLTPDLVILGFYVGNDIQDNYHAPQLRVVDGYLQDGEPQKGLLPYKLRVYLETHSHLYHFIWPMVKRLSDPVYAAKQSEAAINQLATYSRTEDHVTREMWDANRSRLAEIARSVSDHNISLLVLVIPDPLQLDMGKWRNLLKSTGSSSAAFDPHKPTDRIMSICRELNIEAINLLPVLSRAMQGEPMYLPLDGHWTRFGNRLAAEAVFDYIETQREANQTAAKDSKAAHAKGSL